MHRREKNALSRPQPCNVFADLDDFTADVAAQYVRQLYPWQSLAHPKVEVIHGTGFDADEYLVLARLRVGNIFVAQDFRTTKFVNADGFHEGVLLLVWSDV